MHIFEELLIPKKINNKKRFGRNFDGGYVLSADHIVNSSQLISLGCNNEYSFEQDFLLANPNTTVSIYDGSSKCDLVSIYPNKVSFHNTNIYSFEEINIEPNSIIKMDIEGSEYDILNQCNNYENINQLIVEYHFGISAKMNVEVWVSILKKMNENFNLIHIHGNNFGSSNVYGSIPAVIECTYLNKNIQTLTNLEDNCYPINGIDFSNVPGSTDYSLCWWRK